MAANACLRSNSGRGAFPCLALRGGSALRSSPNAYAQEARPGNSVRFPPDWTGDALTAAPAEIEVWPGEHASLLAINGSVPAPTIRVRRGHRFAARVENRLAEDLVLHWHGIPSPAQMDGNLR
ncbi:MAG: multicopper oxidase domain-containing protein [Planctomycetes bacterium]|nr:multicopper oxidase domain-containing protein [Planctomycetota bacterium]